MATQVAQTSEQPLAAIISRLWEGCSARAYGIGREEFERLLLEIGNANHWGLPPEQEITISQQEALLTSLKIEDLMLARACASGNEKAWEKFLLTYRELLYNAACAITKQDALGRELADSLYADLFGTTTRNGVRRSKLESYSGRGSLAGWLRSVLAQRFVDEYRQSRHAVSLEDQEIELASALPEAQSSIGDLPLREISESLGVVLTKLDAEDRFLLHAYYLDQRNLAQIANLLGVHESTISRKLHRLTSELRKQLLKQMQSGGMSRRAAEEALQADVRDLEIDVRKFLQVAAGPPFTKWKAAEGENI
jgi:RNA polymerase sigma-70 factor (ECF subfamily)